MTTTYLRLLLAFLAFIWSVLLLYCCRNSVNCNCKVFSCFSTTLQTLWQALLFDGRRVDDCRLTIMIDDNALCYHKFVRTRARYTLHTYIHNNLLFLLVARVCMRMRLSVCVCDAFLYLWACLIMILPWAQARLPAELKHISKQRKRNQPGFP